MQALTLDELEAQRERFDAEAARSDGIDVFCTSTDWGLPAHAAFMPDRTSRIHVGAHGYVALMEHVGGRGERIWMPLEMVWGLGCPLVGGDPRALADEAVSWVSATHGWDALLVTGAAADAPLVAALVGAARRLRLGLAGPPVRRCLIDLDGGEEAFLARRSRNLRRALVRARARVAARGVTFESIVGSALGSPIDGEALYERLLATERRSWKAAEGGGLAAPEMQAFYGAMTPRLAARGRLVLTFARHEGRDVGYILGARFAGVYRGLQFSYDDDWAAFGLGNVLQLETMAWAAAQGLSVYDLGAEVEYKLRWADRIVEALPILVRR